MTEPRYDLARNMLFRVIQSNACYSPRYPRNETSRFLLVFFIRSTYMLEWTRLLKMFLYRHRGHQSRSCVGPQTQGPWSRLLRALETEQNVWRLDRSA